MNPDLQGTVIKAVGAQYDGLLEVKTFPNGTGQFVGGSGLSLLQCLELMLNFTSGHVVVEEFFPDPPAAHTSTMAYQLVTGNVDITIGFLYFVLPRLKYGSLVVALNQEVLHVYFKQPQNIITYQDVYQKPIPSEVLLSFAFLLFIIGSLVEISTLISSSSWGWSDLLNSQVKALQWTYATIAQQGSGAPRSISFLFTLILILGLISSSLLYIFYSASILSYFAQDTVAITNFTKFLSLKYTVFLDSTLSSSLLSKDGVNAGSDMVYLKIDQNTSILRAFKGGHAHFDSDDVFYPEAKNLGIDSRDACGLSKVRVFQGADIRTGFYCRPDFPYRNAFKMGGYRLRSTGILAREHFNYYRNTVYKCDIKKLAYHDHLGLEEVSAPFRIYIGGIITAIGIFITESLITKFVPLLGKIRN